MTSIINHIAWWITVIIALITSPIKAQEKKNQITISGIAAHYINNEKYNLIGPFYGYYKFPVDPGGEVLFLRATTKNIKIGTGFNFQSGRVASYMSGLRRFQFYEMAIPIIFQNFFKLNEKNGLFLTSGIYSGMIPRINAQSPDKNENWHDYTDFDSDEKKSDDTCFMDIYFDIGYSRLFPKFADISFSPFIKYRINSTWLNYHQKKFHFGVKLTYILKYNNYEKKSSCDLYIRNISKSKLFFSS